MSLRSPRICTLFGGERGWNVGDWTASDDRVRGGKSQSHFKITQSSAAFCGNLDIDTLGNAGFASQRTTHDDRHWDLSDTDGIELVVDSTKSDAKRYAFIVKDDLLPKDPTSGREQSTTSWEYEFQVSNMSADPDRSGLVSIIIPWTELKPTYRGKEKDPGRLVKVQDIRRFSIMMRSYFGQQKGPFSLQIESIATVTKIKDSPIDPARRSIGDSNDDDSSIGLKPSRLDDVKGKHRVGNLLTRILGSCHRL